MNKLIVIILSLLLISSAANAFILPAGVFSDFAVLQQGMKVPVWGFGTDGEKVTVTFQGQTASTVIRNGKWMVTLAPLKPGGPFKMTISGSGTPTPIELSNVLVGEVWVCSGQSNMQFPLASASNSMEAINSSENPKIRLYTVPMNASYEPVKDLRSMWKECVPRDVTDFSAVGYFFGRDLNKALKVPVGLINSSWGGTIAEAWTSPNGLAKLTDYAAWVADENAKKADGPNHPSVLYNAMISPMIPYAIRGVIWYQGESNAGQAVKYRKLFPTMIKSWRDAWGEGQFPFLFVQLAPFMAVKDQPQESAWAELREAQLMTAQSCPKTGMAVITDVGDPNDIHPKKKEPVGARLALAARAIAYGQKIEYSGPIFQSMKISGSSIELTFDHVGSGLEAKDGDLKGFAIASADRKFVFAQAKIEGDKVIVSSPEVPNPTAVRYGWADCPVVNLYNKEGLPASPFRTDDFPMVTAPKAQ